MTPTTLAASVRKAGYAVLIVDLPAKLTDADESPLAAAIAAADNGAIHSIILNMSRVTEMDSAGLSFLIALATRVRWWGQRLLAYGLSKRFVQAFAIAHLDERIGVYATESDALSAVKTASHTARPSSAGGATLTAEDNANWARPVERLKAPPLPPGAVNLNVDGRRPLSPLHGFGPLMRKTYSIRLDGAAVTPAEVIAVWKQGFAGFWPKGNDFHGASGGITPGAVGVLNLTLLGPLKLHTGVFVIYADDTSFCFMTPQGHMFGGLITFSAYDDGGVTVAHVQPLIRASDPMYDLTLRLGVGAAIEDAFWHRTLQNLAAHFGVQASAQQQATIIDPKVQWSQAGNLRYNAAIRSTFYTLAAPLRWLRRIVSR